MNTPNHNRHKLSISQLGYINRQIAIVVSLLSFFSFSLLTLELAFAYNVTYTEQLPGIPEDIDFDLSSGNIYAITPDNLSVQVLDGKNDTVIDGMRFVDGVNGLASFPTDVASNSENGDIYISANTVRFDPSTSEITEDCSDRNASLKCTVLVIDDDNGTVIDNIAVDRSPNSISFDPINGDMYVLHNYLRQTSPGIVTIINSSNNTVAKTIDTGLSVEGDLKIAFNPVDGDVYVTNPRTGIRNGSTGIVSIIDGQNNSLVGTLPVGVLPFVIGSNPNNGKTYVGNSESRTISIIDDHNDTDIKTIQVDGTPDDIAFSPENGDTYVALGLPNSIIRIDGNNDTIIDTIFVNGIPDDIAFNPENGDIYVANSDKDVVSVIDEKTNSIIENIPLQMSPLNIDRNPANGNLYVTNNLNNTIGVIRPS